MYWLMLQAITGMYDSYVQDFLKDNSYSCIYVSAPEIIKMYMQTSVNAAHK